MKHLHGENMPYVSGSGLNRSEQLSFSVTSGHYIGFFHSFSHPDFMTVIQNRGNQQSNLFMISAGNDLRVSTMRPDLISSVRIEERRSGTTKVGRGFLQLISQTV